MNLSEMSGDLLSQITEFKVDLWWDPAMQVTPRDQMLRHFTAQFTTDVPPGITEIEADAIDYGEPKDELVPVVVRMTVEDFIRNSIEYDNDPYDVLKDVKEATDPETTKAALEFIKTADLRVAGISSGEDGLSADNRPTQPNL